MNKKYYWTNSFGEKKTKRKRMMKALWMGVLQVLLVAGPAMAETVTVRDEDGNINQYEVSRHGDDVTIFDRQRDSYITGYVAEDGARLFDNDTDSYLQIEREGD